MQRFFLPEFLPLQDEVVSLAAIHHQLRRVLRVKPGTQVIVLDNAGNERLLEVESSDRRETMARVVEVRPAPAEPTVVLTLYQCILKPDKFEMVLQKATELGVTTVVPVISNRTVSRPGRVLLGKQKRWDAIVREAAEQSARGVLPVVAPACSFDEAVADAMGTRLIPWEEGTSVPGLLGALGQSSKPVDAVSILIGPEGGLEAEEIDAATSAGWQVVTLGPRILRAETAALTTLSIVTSALGWMGDAATVKVAAASKSSKQSVRPTSDKRADVEIQATPVETSKTPKEPDKAQDKGQPKASDKDKVDKDKVDNGEKSVAT